MPAILFFSICSFIFCLLTVARTAGFTLRGGADGDEEGLLAGAVKVLTCWWLWASVKSDAAGIGDGEAACAVAVAKGRSGAFCSEACVGERAVLFSFLPLQALPGAAFCRRGGKSGRCDISILYSCAFTYYYLLVHRWNDMSLFNVVWSGGICGPGRTTFAWRVQGLGRKTCLPHTAWLPPSPLLAVFTSLCISYIFVLPFLPAKTLLMQPTARTCSFFPAAIFA